MMNFTPSVRRNGTPIFSVPITGINGAVKNNNGNVSNNNSGSVNLKVASTPPVQAQATPKPMKWGEPTWFLFHTLSQKIRDESFPLIKNDLLNMFFMICRNLPCPSCADHATKYMQNVNFSRITTKSQLITLFFEFHNTVNAKKGFPIFPLYDLEEKYSKANTIEIIRNFLGYYADKSRSVRNIAHDFFRQRAVSQVKDWLKTNLHHFNP
jgi:hypothetical protein